MLTIQTQENKNNANTTTNTTTNTPGARSPSSSYRPPHSQCHYTNTELSSPTTASSHIQQQPGTSRLSSSPPTTVTNTPTPRNYNHNYSLQHRRQKRISATFGGTGSVIGGGSGSEESSSSASSPSPSSSASSPSYSTSSYFQPATPSPTATSSRRLSPLLESSSASASAHPFPYAQSPTFPPAGSLLFTPLSSSSSPVPPTSTTSTMTNVEGMTTAITTTGGRRDSRAEPYYLPLERPMHPFDSLPSPSPLSSAFNATTTTSPQLPPTSKKAHKINTFGIGPVFGPFPVSSSPTTTTLQQTEKDGATNEGDIVVFDDCGSGSGNGSGNVSRRGGGARGSTRLRMSMMSTSSGSIPEERQEEGEVHETSTYFRPTGGRARSTFGYDDHYHHYYPLSPTSPLALSALPSPIAAATPTSSTTESSAQQLQRRLLQQQQLEQQPRVVDDRRHPHHALSSSLPPLPLSSSVHPPRIITTALHIPHFAPSSSSLSPASATTTLASPYPLTAAVSSSSSPSIYSHTPLSPPTSSTSSSSSISAFATERGGGNYNNSTTAPHFRNGGERNLLFPSSNSLSLGLGIRLGGDINNCDRTASQKKTKKDEKNAISPSLLSASPSSTSLPRPLSPPLPLFPSLPPPVPTDHLQIDHLHYYQQGLLHRRNSARTRIPLSTYDLPNDDEYPIGGEGGRGSGGRFTFDDDLTSTSTTNAASSPAQPPLTPPPRSSSLSRPRRRLSALAKRIFTRSPPTPSPSPSSPSSSPAIAASNTTALVRALTKSSSTVSVNVAVSSIDTAPSTHHDLPAPVTAVTPSSYHNQHQPYYQHHAYTTSHPPLTTFTTLFSHDISKPITKYPFGIPHDHSKTNPEEDDEDEDEDEMVEDIYLYTMTHLHPTTFVPTQPASDIGAGAGTGACILPSSQASLTSTPSLSSFHLPQSHHDMQVQSRDVLHTVSMLPQHNRDVIDSLSEEEEGEVSKQQASTKKKCPSLAIFRFFLKK